MASIYQEDLESVEPQLLSRLSRLESMVTIGGEEQRFDTHGLLFALWRGKWLVAAVVMLCVAVMAAIVFSWADEYKAEAILTPAGDSSGSSLLRLGGQIGGLASLAGIGAGADAGRDKTQLAIHLLQSWGFLEAFIKDQHLEVELHAATGWDRDGDRIRIDRKLYDPAAKAWVGPDGAPSGWELYEDLKDRLDVRQDKMTGLVALSVKHYSPTMAKRLVDGLVSTVNAYMRDRDQVEARRSIAYLQKQIEQTSLTEMQQVFYTLIEEQTKKLMLTEVSDEYVLKTLSPAKIPEQKSGPNRGLLCLLAALGGFLLASTLWLGLLDVRPTVASGKVISGGRH